MFVSLCINLDECSFCEFQIFLRQFMYKFKQIFIHKPLKAFNVFFYIDIDIIYEIIHLKVRTKIIWKYNRAFHLMNLQLSICGFFLPVIWWRGRLSNKVHVTTLVVCFTLNNRSRWKRWVNNLRCHLLFGNYLGFIINLQDVVRKI